MSKLRLAIIGAGPAGIYAADLLIKSPERDFEVSIDLFDLLPAPYGLVRYGVAPDHPRIKGIIKALYEVLDRGDIRFFGNVTYGKDLTLEDLKAHYNAVIFELVPLAMPTLISRELISKDLLEQRILSTGTTPTLTSSGSGISPQGKLLLSEMETLP